MARTTKPYRRYRARRGDSDGEDGLGRLRELNARESGRASATESPPRARPAPRPRPGPAASSASSAGAEARGPALVVAARPRPGGLDRPDPLVLLVAVVAWAGFGYWALNSAVGESNGKITESARTALDEPSGGLLGTPTNTLILGVDKRKGKTRSRADTILIMRTDPDSGRIKYLSIPRDWRVDLPGYGNPEDQRRVLLRRSGGDDPGGQAAHGLPIHHLIVIKFNGFPKMVDALGGVTVTNPTAIVNCPYEAGRTVSFAAGQIDLNGAQALEFSRVRKCDTDFNRALRQQAVVAGMKSKVLSLGGLWRAPWRGADVVRTLQTDIGTMDMVKLGWLQARLDQRKGDRILLTGSRS